jgi:hypothetical protein
MHRVLIRHGSDPDGFPLFVRIDPARKRKLPKDVTRYRIIEREGEFCLLVNDERLCHTTDPEHVHGG